MYECETTLELQFSLIRPAFLFKNIVVHIYCVKGVSQKILSPMISLVRFCDRATKAKFSNDPFECVSVKIPTLCTYFPLFLN